MVFGVFPACVCVCARGACGKPLGLRCLVFCVFPVRGAVVVAIPWASINGRFSALSRRVARRRLRQAPWA